MIWVELYGSLGGNNPKVIFWKDRPGCGQELLNIAGKYN